LDYVEWFGFWTDMISHLDLTRLITSLGFDYLKSAQKPESPRCLIKPLAKSGFIFMVGKKNYWVQVYWTSVEAWSEEGHAWMELKTTK
jgi:hypothetical protein